MNIDQIIDDIIAREGDYVDHPDDRGGPTRWGITEKVARENGYTGAMRDLPIETARVIYKTQYWFAPKWHRVHARSPSVAAELADTGVNMGVTVAAQFLQRLLRAMTGEMLVVDGVVGPKTLAALDAYLDRRGEQGIEVLIKGLNCLQGERYISLTETRPENRSFIYGWLAHRV